MKKFKTIKQRKTMRLTKSVLTLPKRDANAHKGEHGGVLVIAGSSEYVGAAVLATNATLAALKTGIDLVTVASPEEVALVINCVTPTAITVKLPGAYLKLAHFHRIKELAQKAEVILIGPGLGRKSDAVIRKICRSFAQWKIIDADAIKAVGRQYKKIRNAIFTPHTKEFEFLSGQSTPIKFLDKARIVKKIVQYAPHSIILLKGQLDMIAMKGKFAVNSTGNATMAKGGTGDVLAGFAAGFLARTHVSRTHDPFKAACMAAFLNGAIGDWLAKRYGSTYLTEDIISNVHKVWRIP